MKDRAVTKNGWGRSWRDRLQAVDQQVVGLVIALAVLLLIFGARIPGQFFRPTNLMSIGEGVTLIGMTTLAA